LIGIGLMAAILLAGCGGASTGGSSAASASSGTHPTSVVLVHTATVMVKGKAETVLTNASGFTLYYFTPDSPAKIACTGSCAKIWPPLLVTSGTPASSPALPGKLSTLRSLNGDQVLYNGHALYHYSGDSAPGQANGEGLFGKWFVATPSLGGSTSGSTSGAGASGTSTPGSYGGYGGY